LPGQPVGVESHHWTFRQSEVDLEVDEVQKEALVQGQQLTNHLKNDERKHRLFNTQAWWYNDVCMGLYGYII